MKTLNITPVPKPRMTRADTWKERPCVLKYWSYKDNLVKEAKRVGYEIGDSLEGITFVLPMPKSLSKKKRQELNGSEHMKKPDLDNIIKAFQDCLSKEDSNIHTINAVRKIWGEEGKIIINS